MRGNVASYLFGKPPRTPEGGQAGKGDKPPPLHILRSCGAHTQLSLATFKGELMMEKCNGNHYWVGYL